jgi:predicted nucleic acid-binding Zn ribbon protein
MKCRACGAEIAEKAIVCYRCGAPTAELVERNAPKGKRSVAPIVIAVVVIVIALGVWFAMRAQ